MIPQRPPRQQLTVQAKFPVKPAMSSYEINPVGALQVASWNFFPVFTQNFGINLSYFSKGAFSI